MYSENIGLVARVEITKAISTEFRKNKKQKCGSYIPVQFSIWIVISWDACDKPTVRFAARSSFIVDANRQKITSQVEPFLETSAKRL